MPVQHLSLIHISIFVFDDNSLDNQLHLDGKSEVLRRVGRLVLADLLRARGSGCDQDSEEASEESHR